MTGGVDKRGGEDVRDLFITIIPRLLEVLQSMAFVHEGEHHTDSRHRYSESVNIYWLPQSVKYRLPAMIEIAVTAYCQPAIVYGASGGL